MGKRTRNQAVQGRRHLAILFAMVAVIILAAAIFGKPTITGRVVQDQEDIIYCQGYDEALVPSTSLSPCYPEFVSFKQASQPQPPLPQFIDPLLLMSIAYAESTCDSSLKGGIMQVDACRDDPACAPPQVQIARGTDIFRDAYSTLQQQSFDGKQLGPQELLILSLFAYNRGKQTALRAAEIYAAGGFEQGSPYPAQTSTLLSSMRKACQDVFTLDCAGTQTLCKYDARGNDKCSYYGYGSLYPEKVLSYYQDFCRDTGGKLEEGVFDFSQVGLRSVGSYTMEPHFRVSVPYDAKTFDTVAEFVETAVAQCTDDVENCLDDQVRIFNEQEEGIQLTRECETGVERVFYDLLENIYDCAQTKEGCLCAVLPSYTDEEIEELGLQGKDEYASYRGYFADFDGTYDFTVDGRIFSLEETRLQHTLPNNLPLALPARISFDLDDDGIDAVELFDASGKEVDREENLYLYGSPGEQEKLLGSVDSGSLYALPDQQVSIDVSRTCTINKTIFTVCAVTQPLPHLDPYGGLATGETKIRFGVFLKDTVPPPLVQDVTAQQDTLSGGDTSITWDPSPARDVAYYVIHYGAFAFSDTGQAAGHHSLEYEPYDSGSGDPYVLSIPKGYTHVAVTAVDHQGNEDARVASACITDEFGACIA